MVRSGDQTVKDGHTTMPRQSAKSRYFLPSHIAIAVPG
jgi:hypothetical protein